MQSALTFGLIWSWMLVATLSEAGACDAMINELTVRYQCSVAESTFGSVGIRPDGRSRFVQGCLYSCAMETGKVKIRVAKFSNSMDASIAATRIAGSVDSALESCTGRVGSGSVPVCFRGPSSLVLATGEVALSISRTGVEEFDKGEVEEFLFDLAQTLVVEVDKGMGVPEVELTEHFIRNHDLGGARLPEGVLGGASPGLKRDIEVSGWSVRSSGFFDCAEPVDRQVEGIRVPCRAWQLFETAGPDEMFIVELPSAEGLRKTEGAVQQSRIPWMEFEEEHRQTYPEAVWDCPFERCRWFISWTEAILMVENGDDVWIVGRTMLDPEEPWRSEMRSGVIEMAEIAADLVERAGG